jgi:gamma-glutamylcyclotransferase (GGCT)/AIG2-like uncharacterized protein YtfP
MAGVLLFVYGSLKRGGLHHAELAGATFVGEAETAPGYALTRLGDYRALIRQTARQTAGETQVRGELFELPAARLPALDEFEGQGYERRTVTLSPEHSRGFREALAYFRKAR